ncbi:acid phosphatase [Caulobacter sp. CCUG 60055]|uniref:phosphatase PAP2 family protein n=1 Tax=Caulobacter sp. CCUG 60055 TaxID=2100090 RepID=UPI001FA721B0|nr:phosphatase PAP2 family protein [Caulobacter sp. CCUG 60055]MCI3182199.1 acid phosphatase [Caulobacter sp. CCUG 60055]
MPRRLLLAAAAVAALAASPALAQAPTPAAKPHKPGKVLQFLTAEDVDARRLLPPPPADDAAAGKADLEAVRQTIAARSPERLAQAKWDDDHEDPSAFFATAGEGFDLKTLPATAEVMKIVQVDAAAAATAAKKVFARKRPWAVDPAIPTCDPDDKPLTSYPSGHAAQGYAFAMTYAVLMPEKAQAFMVRAKDYALSRVVCGAHFPTDIQASHALSAAVVASLLKNPGFQAKVAAAKAELRTAKFTQ